MSSKVGRACQVGGLAGCLVVLAALSAHGGVPGALLGAAWVTWVVGAGLAAAGWLVRRRGERDE